ncbi:MAG: DUF723 domain-containing protein [Bacilli bacterium]|nr:DUF723 domain-containing protein [Bacilli bacterium]
MNDKKDIFINKAKIKHNDKYDYSNVEYIHSKIKVKIICKIHGEFEQTPQAHLRGQGCPLCSNIKRKNTLSSNSEEFINKSKEVHGNKYNYSKVNYINSETKVIIICPTHGEFEMKPSMHLSGQGCPKCKGRNLTLEDIINKANIIHNNKYDYSKVKFSKMHDKVTIICPIHGEFQQTLSKHISKKQGCPICGKKNSSNKKMFNSELFIEKVKEIHHNKYDYSNTKYIGMLKPITYICPIHGEITQRAQDHLRGYGCSKCANFDSKQENEIYNILKEYHNDIIKNDRTILEGKELDIYIPSKNIAIEYNGLRWHSELFNKDKDYHINKTKKCNEKNIKLIQIFEDEYINYKDSIISKIKHSLYLNNNLPKISGRKCSIKIIDNDVAKEFINRYNIYGYKPSTTHFGVFYDNILVCVLSLSSLNKSGLKWLINGFSFNYNYIYQGVFGKLLNFFIKQYNPTEIIAYSDIRFELNKDNNVYIKNNFKLIKEIKPTFQYVLNSNPQNRIDNVINKSKYSKIWNCGYYKYIWHKNKKEA